MTYTPQNIHIPKVQRTVWEKEALLMLITELSRRLDLHYHDINPELRTAEDDSEDERLLQLASMAVSPGGVMRLCGHYAHKDDAPTLQQPPPNQSAAQAQRDLLPRVAPQ